MGRIEINSQRCKGCELCVTVCPVKILKISDSINEKGYHFPEVIDMKKCTGCGLCAIMCPDVAITVYRE